MSKGKTMSKSMSESMSKSESGTREQSVELELICQDRELKRFLFASILVIVDCNKLSRCLTVALL
jgi:hypothetical protein